MISTETQFADRILLQYDQEGHFETEDPNNIRIIGTLNDLGLIVACFTPVDGAPPTKAIVQRLTLKGNNKIAELASMKKTMSGTDCTQIIHNAEDIRRYSVKSYDGMIKTIATGGIGLIVTLLTYLYGKSGSHPTASGWMVFFCVSAGVIWVLNLVFLLILDYVSQNQQWNLIVAAHNNNINPDAVNKTSRWINIFNFVNGLVAVAGIVSFLAFVGIIMYAKKEGGC